MHAYELHDKKENLRSEKSCIGQVGRLVEKIKVEMIVQKDKRNMQDNDRIL